MFKIFFFFIFISSLTLVLSVHVQYKIRQGAIPMRGVNLGGWLVIERWMTGDSPIWKDVPDWVSYQGEFQTMRYLGHAKADSRFEQHRSTWITESDIIEIAKSGLNTVRVPVGYWIVGFDNYDPSKKEEWKIFAPGALKYLDLLFQWCNNHNVSVMISLHAAKGSQNGNDHSAPPDGGKSYWGAYPENVNTTLDAVTFLAARYKSNDCFLGIGLLNEPGATTTNDQLISYYTHAYNAIRQPHNDILLSHAPLITEMNPGGSVWPNFFPYPAYYNALHEWHKYLIWGFEGWSEERLMGEAINGISSSIAQWNGNWMFIGEFSVATTPAFADPQKFQTFASRYFNALKGAHAGWTYWTWKVSGDTNPGRSPWSLRNLIRNGDVKTSWFSY